MFAGATCQAIDPEERARIIEIEWIGFDGETQARISPQLPGNWQLQAVCRSAEGRVFASAKLGDGVAVSELLSDGGLAWSTVLPVARGAVANTELFFGERQIQVLAPSEARGTSTLTAFGLDGDRLWQRTLERVSPRSRPVVATNQVGETVMAWNTPSDATGIEARVQAVSPQNVGAYSIALNDRSVAVSGLISDDLAQSLLIEGQAGFSVQFIDSVGTPVWRRWIDANARPIGAIQDGSDYVVAAHDGVRVLIWRLRGDGRRSQAIEVELSDPVLAGDLYPYDNQRAALALNMEDGASRVLSLNLQRLREVAEFSTISTGEVDAPIRQQEAQFALEQLPSEVESQTLDNPIEPSAGPTPVIRNPEPIETAPEPATDLERASLEPVEPIKVAPQPAAPEPEASPQSEREVSCTFRCAAIGNPLATYPILQTLELEEGEELDSASSRLRRSHKQLCELSGGQPAVESSPECTAR